MIKAKNESVSEIGYVRRVKNFLVYVDGLPSVRIGDLLAGENGAVGFVSALLPSEVEVLLLTSGGVLPGTAFRPAGKELSVLVGPALLGRTISPLGEPVDDLEPLIREKMVKVSLEKRAPGIVDRQFISRQFGTGVTLVDTLLPLGKGQRELVIGDARSGKTGFVIDVIVNQKGQDLVCVYGALGKPTSEIWNLVDILRKNGAIAYTVVVASFSSDSAPLVFLTPQTAVTVAEYFQNQGKDVLLVLDDMGSHAKIYREIALLSERPPGREAYPGDIFYQHAHLLERAGSFGPSVGGKSITALPLIELDLNDFTSFIPTNLMSMTDGHLLFRSVLYSQGQRPAADIFLSVSRVGQQTQQKIQNELAFRIKQLLSQAEGLATVASFSVELPPSTQLILRQKAIIMELLRQGPLLAIAKEIQTVMLALPFTEWGSAQDADFFRENKDKLLLALKENKALAEVVAGVFKFASLNDLISHLDSLGAELDKETKSAEPMAVSEVVDSETWLPKF